MLCLCYLQMDKTYQFRSLALYQKELLLNLNWKRLVVIAEIALCSQPSAIPIVGHFKSVFASNYYIKLPICG